MWSYYGSKTDQAKHYPVPVHGKIIEPFAGTAKYSLRFWEKEVLLVDKYEVIVGIWKWLQKCSKQDILSLPVLKEGEKLDELKWDCIEQRWFMGFQIAAADATPRNTVRWRVSTQRPKRQRTRLKNVAANLDKIRHWEIRYGGEHYKHGNKAIDFSQLGNWCKSREGQIIVCETTKADWLPFKPMIRTNGTAKKTMEAIWTNQPTAFDNLQLSIF